MRAVQRYTLCRWVLLYVERWLKAPMQVEGGSLEERESGTPQGGVVSPVLANIFLHLAFDTWMAECHSNVPFERYADDIRDALSDGDPGKRSSGSSNPAPRALPTRGPPGEDEDRPTAGTPIGGTGMPRPVSIFSDTPFARDEHANREGRLFTSFSPGVSNKAAKAMRADDEKELANCMPD